MIHKKFKCNNIKYVYINSCSAKQFRIYCKYRNMLKTHVLNIILMTNNTNIYSDFLSLRILIGSENSAYTNCNLRMQSN